MEQKWNYKKYLKLCNLLTCRNPELNYIEITKELFDMLRIKAFISIEDLEMNKKIKPENISTLKNNMDEIFENKLLDGDENYIGFINLISFQCVIAFTERFDKDMFVSEILSVNWTNVYVLKELLTTNSYFEDDAILFVQDSGGNEYTLENIMDALGRRIFFR